MKTLIMITLSLALCGSLSAQSALGIWKTIDDASGEAKSHVEIYEKGGYLYGKIIKLLRKPADTRCDQCSGSRQNQPLIGMNIIEKLSNAGSEWKGGKILDPENGNEYNCSVWLEKNNPNELKVRGKHWTGIYRTQTWYRVK